ncbi:MAG TPA: LuxR C-terminal-related transcriptional regulator [Pseudonocardiaceae bacterium]
MSVQARGISVVVDDHTLFTISALDRPRPDALLSARELEVLQLAALAMSNAQIGRRLVIAESNPDQGARSPRG